MNGGSVANVVLLIDFERNSISLAATKMDYKIDG